MKLAFAHVSNSLANLVPAIEAFRCTLAEWLVVPDGAIITLSSTAGEPAQVAHVDSHCRITRTNKMSNKNQYEQAVEKKTLRDKWLSNQNANRS
jgi:hypothetical protein